MLRVLVIDDAPAYRALLGYQLAEDGDIERAGEAADLEAAMAQARTLRPDVILLDIHLGGTDALGSVGELRAAAGGAGVLLVSAVTDDERQDAVARSGADGHLAKGAGAAALREAVRAAAP